MNEDAVIRMRELRQRNAEIYREMGRVGSGRADGGTDSE